METAISLNQIGLYNPQRQSAAITEALFVVRQKQFELLVNKIVKEKENSIPQHYLIIGQRGMGKTTLLKRMEVELHKEQYRNRFVPLLFSEEQYNIKDLAKFWNNCLNALANSLESEDPKKYQVQILDIDKKIQELSKKTPEIIAEEAYKYLMSTCRDLCRRPVLLIDNIGLVFSRLDNNRKNKQEQWALRKLLSENGAPIIVSAGTVVTDEVVKYDMPFYDFFQIQYLKKLSFEEFTELLENLAERTQLNPDIVSALRKERARLQTLYHFTGGNPRTAVMLFKLLVKGFLADVTDDLNALVDEVTPLYKAKLEELPPQQQVIIDAIAMNWDAIPFKKLAIDADLEPNLLSPQLKRLVDDGWIETVEADKISRRIKEEVEGVIKGSAYIICERFFNTWFLLRSNNRRQKKGVNCLSEFLECLYGEERMLQEADRFLQGEIMSSQQIMRGLSLAESKLITPEVKNEIDKKITNAILDLSEEDKKILVEKFNIIPEDFLEEKLPILDVDTIIKLTNKLKTEDAEFWENMADSLQWDEQYEKAVVCYSKSLEINPNNEDAWFEEGYSLYRLQRFEEAIECWDKVIEITPDDAAAYSNRGIAKVKLSDYHGAIEDYYKAIEIKPDFAIAYYNRGYAKKHLSDYHGAIEDYDKAIEIKPDYAEAYNNRGYAKVELSDYHGAIEDIDKSIEMNPNNAEAWDSKGCALVELKNKKEAAFAYEKARSINPKELIFKFHLTFLYRDKLNEMNKAIELFNEIEQEINKDKNKKFVNRYFLNKTLFDLHNRNEGLAKEHLLQAFEVLEKENNIASIAKEYWWRRLASVVLDLGYGSWLLAILEEKGYDIVLSPYYTAIQALEIEKQDSKNGERDAEIYLKNRAVEISEPAREIIKKIRKYMD